MAVNNPPGNGAGSEPFDHDDVALVDAVGHVEGQVGWDEAAAAGAITLRSNVPFSTVKADSESAVTCGAEILVELAKEKAVCVQGIDRQTDVGLRIAVLINDLAVQVSGDELGLHVETDGLAVN